MTVGRSPGSGVGEPWHSVLRPGSESMCIIVSAIDITDTSTLLLSARRPALPCTVARGGQVARPARDAYLAHPPEISIPRAAGHDRSAYAHVPQPQAQQLR